MKVLITGGAGKSGIQIVDRLVQAQHSVLVFDNLSTGDRRGLPFEARFVMGDVRDYSLLNRALRDFKADVLIHWIEASSVAGEGIENLDHCVSGLIQVIKSFRDSDCRQLIIRPQSSAPEIAHLQSKIIELSIKTFTERNILKQIQEDLLLPGLLSHFTSSKVDQLGPNIVLSN